MKKLTRSRTARVIAGICGGLGEYFNIDPVIFRIVFIVLSLGGGFGIVLYLIMWVAVPEQG